MYKKYSKLLRNSSFFFLVILIIFTLNPITVKGEWNEDFPDPNLSEWDLRATVWNRPDNVIQVVEHGWYVEDGVLKSDGLPYPDALVWQTACRQIDFVIESWSADVYDEPNWVWAFFIGRNLDFNFNTTLSATPPEPGYFLWFKDSQLDWSYDPDPNVASDVEAAFNDVAYDSVINTSGWHSYEFQFNTQTIDLNMDDDLFFSFPVQHADKTATFDSFNSLCVVASSDDANMFDNITANEVGVTPPPPTTSSITTTANSTIPLSESNGGDAAYTILLFGSGSIIALSSIYTLNRYFKKKD